VASGPREWRDAALDLDREVGWAREQREWTARLRIRRGIGWGPVAHEEVLRVAAREAPDLVLLAPGRGVACTPETLDILFRRLPCSVLVLPGTHPRPADVEGPGAPAGFTDPPAVAREEPAQRWELAAAGD